MCSLEILPASTDSLIVKLKKKKHLTMSVQDRGLKEVGAGW